MLWQDIAGDVLDNYPEYAYLLAGTPPPAGRYIVNGNYSDHPANPSDPPQFFTCIALAVLSPPNTSIRAETVLGYDLNPFGGDFGISYSPGSGMPFYAPGEVIDFQTADGTVPADLINEIQADFNAYIASNPTKVQIASMTSLYHKISGGTDHYIAAGKLAVRSLI